MRMWICIRMHVCKPSNFHSFHPQTITTPLMAVAKHHHHSQTTKTTIETNQTKSPQILSPNKSNEFINHHANGTTKIMHGQLKALTNHHIVPQSRSQYHSQTTTRTKNVINQGEKRGFDIGELATVSSVTITATASVRLAEEEPA